jgi:hypothetical protein
MSQSVRLSDELVEAAKAKAKLFYRSPPQQIEHWAAIGRVLEPALSYPALERLAEVGAADVDAAMARTGSPKAVRRTRAIIRRTSKRIVSAG